MSNAPVTIVGNVAMDPLLNQVGGGTDKVFFTVASDHRFMKNGEWASTTSFFAVVAWRDLAVKAATLLEKGLRVIVTGRLDSWQPEGEEQSRVQIVADDIAVSVRWIDGVTRTPFPDSGGTRRASASSAPEQSPW